MKENFKENIKPFVFVMIVLILTAITAHSQRKFSGMVTEVLDGKTCVIKLQSGQVTAVLQYIEIPEPDQPMRDVVRTHFEKLVLNKQVEFLPRIVMRDRTVGQLLVKNVDVSQQMLRDGAAWYAIPEKSGQDETQSLLYLDNETQARGEKRGVWSVANLKPSWEHRAEAEEKRLQEAKLAAENARNEAFVAEMQRQKKRAAPQKKQFNTEAMMWASTNEEIKLPPNVTNIGGLWVSNDPSGKYGVVFTPLQRIELIGKSLPKIGFGLGHIFINDVTLGSEEVCVLGVETETEKFVFLTNSNLTLTLDNQKINLGKARRVAGKTDFGVRETLYYLVKRPMLEKVLKAENISVKVGNYEGKVTADAQQVLKNMRNLLP